MENQCQRWSLHGGKGINVEVGSLQWGKCSIEMSTLRPWTLVIEKVYSLDLSSPPAWYIRILQIWKLCLPQTSNWLYLRGFGSSSEPEEAKGVKLQHLIWLRPKAKVDRTPYALEQLKAAINFNDGIGKCTHSHEVGCIFQQDCSSYFRARARSFMKSIILNNCNIRNGSQAWT